MTNRFSARLLCFLILFVIEAIAMVASDTSQSIRVMTLNVAHGRKRRFHQTFIFTSTIRSHLDEIAEVIQREDPDIVALQEADGPCWWSGRFDHVKYIADKCGMKYTFRGSHMNLFRLDYGTAIISKVPLINSESIPFPSTCPSPPKGFVISNVKWNGLDVDVVSVHLDFLRASKQREQVQMIADKVRQRKRPVIIMGDFNCGWEGDASPLQMLCDDLNLKAFRSKETEGLESYYIASKGMRLDWILLPFESHMDFSEYSTVPDVLSDHFAVRSEVKMLN